MMNVIRGNEMAVIFKSKSEIRNEMNDAVAAFLARGGVVEVCKPSRRGSTQKMRCKTSRGSFAGSGIARGYPTKSTVGA